MTYKKTVIDEIGREHPRKNQYIIDTIEAESHGNKSLPSKKDHPYNIRLEEYKKKEKDLLSTVEEDAKKAAEDKYQNKKMVELGERLYIAENMVDFYRENVDVSYDALLKLRIHELEIEQVPEIIENEIYLKNTIDERKKALKNVQDEEIKEAEKIIDEKTRERKDTYEKEVQELKDSYDQGYISKKAYKSELEMKDRSLKEDTTSYKYINPKISLEEEIENLKHHQKVDAETQLNVLESDIAYARRTTPIEVEKTKPINSWISILLPGLGQLLNKQYMKAFLFFLGSLFIYLIAIPYSLGYGNYQGEGIVGLITLAEGGGKLDRSILFMIEGILALLFLTLGLIILIASFKDVNTVEKNLIKGVRPKKWFETKNTILTDGFPYLITTPALLIILFIVVVPIITAILISFTNMDPDNQNKFTWIGLDNYIAMAKGQGNAGKPFWLILGWTLVWTFGATTLAIVIGFLLALLVNNKRVRGKKFFRTIYLLPWAIPAFITIMFFSIMVSRNGVLANFLEAITGQVWDIKNDPTLTRIALILLQGWLGNAYIFLLTTGVMQGISDDLYEAAAIDGATGIQQTTKITIPLVLFQIAPILINQYTFNFNNFSIIYLFNQGGPFNPALYGNVAGTTDILISYIYKLTMENQYQAMGAAITVFISIIVMFISFLGYRNTAAFKED